MKPNVMSDDIRQLTAKVPVIPVLEVEDVGAAIPLARALVEGGLNVLEVTLRTPVALKVITEMTKVDGAIVGAGTLLNSDDVLRAKQAGAQFGVSPGSTQSLLRCSEENSFPLMPGVASASEVMQAYEQGFSLLKFFPAEVSGGIAAIKSFAGPFKDIQFCPTGGINFDKAGDYLALPNVVCVGGSWVATKTMIKSQDWKLIKNLSRKSAALSSMN